MQNNVTFSCSRDELVALLVGEIDHHTAKGHREKIDTEIFLRKPKRLILDFSSVTFMDSSGIGLIIGRYEVARELSVSLTVRGLSNSLRKIVRLSGVEHLDGVTVE